MGSPGAHFVSKLGSTKGLIYHNICFCNRVVSTWNDLPEHIVNIESFLSFKKALRSANFQSVITFNRLNRISHYCTPVFILAMFMHDTHSYIYTTKIDGVVCPPNISETVAGRLMKLAHRQRIASTTIKLISKKFLLSILSILFKIFSANRR